jgi:hypothetical protein
MVPVLPNRVLGPGRQTSPALTRRVATWQGRSRVAEVHAMRHERMFEPIAARFVLVDTGGWFWIRTAGAPQDGGPGDGELHQPAREGATFAAT